MNNFENVRFHGTFRDYQQRVLDRSDQYLKDGKINIVAAPGSGKTVLGLELIRKLGSPCIILSPTTAIRQQWGERFRDLFLDDKTRFEALFSNDLHDVRLINSVTYQALYTAVEKVASDADGDTDCSDIDLFSAMKEHGIQTICLDEAHHLKNEWQKALEKFVAALDSDVKLISLTATPPYDSEGSEWSRYANLCGEIDEEIFVPELVGQNTLCPHQDYVYFNYPTKNEIASLKEYREHAAAVVEEIGKLDSIRELCNKVNGERDYETLFASAKEYIALLVLIRHYGFEIDPKLIRELMAKRSLPDFKIQYAEIAIRFLLDGDLLDGSQKDAIVGILKKNSVYEKGKASLVLNDRLKRSLISSVGKLESIRQIARSEIASMGDRLRMLILTDYIKKENLTKIATAEEFTSVNIVSIFETLRRNDLVVNIGVLSGSLVILPESIDLSDGKYRKTSIPGTGYCTVEFTGSSHGIVNFVGRLFEKGEIQILVGTKSLLGEGWDSPCINSLILASFVGSFVLSNQMRGRAIRIDENDPGKISNIWHLVTVEPEYLFKDKRSEQIATYLRQDKDVLYSYDFEILKRRFDSFMGPNYTTGVIESGIERITAIAPPYNKAGIERINKEMLMLSANRSDVAEKWRGEVADGRFAVAVETEVPTEKRVPIFTFFNFALFAILLAVENVILRISMAVAQSNVSQGLTFVVNLTILAVTLYFGIKIVILHGNPAHSIKTLGNAVYDALRECGLIAPSAKVETEMHKELLCVSLYLRNASIHDQNIFNTAMTEMLTPIENPRYILIAKKRFGGYNYSLSFACPSILGKKKESVEVLAEKLRGSTGNFEPVYTYKEGGRKLILKCRKNSYITYNEKAMGKKYRVAHDA